MACSALGWFKERPIWGSQVALCGNADWAGTWPVLGCFLFGTCGEWAPAAVNCRGGRRTGWVLLGFLRRDR